MANKFVHEDKQGHTIIYYQQNVDATTKATIGFKCGSSKDGKLLGIAHLLEHMLFTSTESYDKQSVYDFFSMTNTRHNAFTTEDLICVDFDCTNSNVEEVFKAMSSILYKKDFTQEELDRERKVVIHELKKYLDEYNAPSGFKKSINSMEILGSEESLNKITVQDLKNYSDRYFVKENLVISLVSSLPYEEISPLLEEYFISKAPSKPKNKVLKEKSEPAELKDTLQYQNTPRAKTFTIEFAFNGLKSKADNVVYTKVENFLFNSASGYLMERFREENPLCYTPTFYNYVNGTTKLKVFEILTSPDRLHESIDTMISLLNDIVYDGISKEDFFKLKTNFITERERKNKLKIRNASKMLEDYLNGEEVFVSGVYEKLLQLTQEDINKYLKTVYGCSQLSVFLGGDVAKACNLPEKQEIVDILKKACNEPLVVPDEVVNKKLNEELIKRYTNTKVIPTIKDILSKYRLDYKILYNPSLTKYKPYDLEFVSRILKKNDSYKNYRNANFNKDAKTETNEQDTQDNAEYTL